MADITTIELKKSTHIKLKTIGSMSECFDDVVNRLIKDHNEINKYIESYVKNANGECVFETIFGHTVLANHHFVGDTCEKCGIQSPIVEKHDHPSEIVIQFLNGCYPITNSVKHLHAEGLRMSDKIENEIKTMGNSGMDFNTSDYDSDDECLKAAVQSMNGEGVVHIKAGIYTFTESPKVKNVVFVGV